MKRTLLLTLLLFALSVLYGQPAKFVLFPDTQSYLESCPEILEKQVEAVTKNSPQYAAVIHLGDITQDNHPLEWYVAGKLFQSFDEANLPFTFSLGNHDIGSAPRKTADTRESAGANKYFPIAAMKEKAYWGGSLTEKIDNHYILLSAGGIDWLIISLAFGVSDETLEWANRIVAQHPDRKVILNTHAYMYFDDTRMGKGDNGLPQHYGIGKDTSTSVNDGEQIWAKFVSNHANIMAVVSGHVTGSGVGTLVSTGKNGNRVYQMLSNYQREIENAVPASKGYYRILTFDKASRRIEVETISAVTGEKHPSEKHNFIFENVDF
ncbi:MAG: metallophosphoesterase [Prevotellaceae bacterium]|jgi:hypothetical protein|nr:metallophosphoesterase [Prevotellaceae bacterium]